MKYIVKNCPCIYRGYSTNYECDYKNGSCEEITDCLIKQVIEKCIPEATIGGINETAENILQLFETEECE